MSRLVACSTLPLLACTIGCAGPDKEQDLDASVHGTTEEADRLEEIDPGTFESCTTRFQFADQSPAMDASIAADDVTTISARLVNAVNRTELEACNGYFSLHFAIDANDDPAVYDWHHLPAAVDWTWEGDRTWGLEIDPATGLAPGANYAVELSLHLEDVLPLGHLWVWKTE